MPGQLRRGDVVNLKPEYVKYAMCGGVHYGEDISGKSWVVDLVISPQNSIDRLVYARSLGPDGAFLELINSKPIPEGALVKNEFLTMVYQAQASEARRRG